MTKIMMIPDNSIIRLKDNTIIGIFGENDDGSTSVILENGSITSRDFDRDTEFELIETFDNTIELVIGLETLLV